MLPHEKQLASFRLAAEGLKTHEIEERLLVIDWLEALYLNRAFDARKRADDWRKRNPEAAEELAAQVEADEQRAEDERANFEHHEEES